MPCYHPITGYRAKRPNPETGRFPIVFNHKDGWIDRKVNLPCGKCIGCKLEYSRQWAVRCTHEAQMHDNNIFITLTYDEKHLPENGSLDKTHFTNFMKRLRQYAIRNKKFKKATRKKFHKDFDKIRYFQCGEYGDQTKRPHHHACLFDIDFHDKYIWRTHGKIRYYRSPTLEKIWTFGNSEIGDVTFESAAYTARYITKKITGPDADKHYKGKKPEYCTMSLKPGLGKEWYEKYGETDVIPNDFIIIRNRQSKVPKYYDYQHELTNKKSLSILKGVRERKARKNKDNEPRRLLVREAIKKSRITLLERGYETERTT